MLSDIYYFFGIFILLSFASQLINFNRFFRVIDWYGKFLKVTGKNAIKDDFPNQEDWNIFITYGLFTVLDGIWMILGLITNNWFIFIGLVVISKTISFITIKLKLNFLKKYIYLLFLGSKTSLYTLMIVNHFHIGLDLWALFRGFLQFP